MAQPWLSSRLVFTRDLHIWCLHISHIPILMFLLIDGFIGLGEVETSKSNVTAYQSNEEDLNEMRDIDRNLWLEQYG